MIELSNVTKKFNPSVTAVKDLSFTVQKGEIFGLIGTSGCGKTTTLKMINRLEEPTAGSIAINGESILDLPPEQLRRKMGYVIQNVGLFPHYSIRQNIAITPRLLDWKSGRIDDRCKQLLNLVGLKPEEFADRMPAALSGGQQQRVGLARALAGDPPVILMDEPFGALDPITKDRIQQEFKKLLQEIKKTIVLVTHDVFEAFDLCDRLCLMKSGRAQQIGTARELLFQPANEFVRSFFDNHRFQLEMISITVEDIWSILNTHSSQARSDNLSVEISDSFFSVFQRSQNADQISVYKNDNEAVGIITVNQFLEGFQEVRQKLREEPHG